MVLGPGELEKKLLEDQRPIMSRVEEQLDQALQRSRDYRQIIIGSEIVKELHPQMRAVLIDKYRGAGWNVEYHSDQRDGDFYTFTPKQETRRSDISWGGRD